MTSAKPMRQSQPAGDPDPRWTAIATRDTRSDGHRPDRIPGADIRFAIVKSALGYLLVARSAKGVCAVLMGDSPSLLERDLRQRFPQVRFLGVRMAAEETHLREALAQIALEERRTVAHENCAHRLRAAGGATVAQRGLDDRRA